ncbi:MAG: ABC transporter permease [Chloroflexi bacterium]|nr:ABC transporter permease [Chloroflexota bacterium]
MARRQKLLRSESPDRSGQRTPSPRSLTFRDIAFGNLKRRRGRTAFLILSLTVGVAMMVAVISVTAAMRASVESKLREYGANMVVLPRGLEMPITYGGVNIASVKAPIGELTEQDATLVASIHRKDAIRGVSPKLVTAIRIDEQEFMMVGVRFRDELRMKPWWTISGDKPALSREVLLGRTAAQQLNRRPGDSLAMGGKDFRVVGVLDEQFSAEDHAIFADLRETGLLFNSPGKVSFIEVSTWCAACPVETIVEQVSEKLPGARVFAVKQLVEAELSQVRLATGFALTLTAIILVVGTLIMLLTMMASVRERTQEIGVLRAIGFRQAHIMRLILTEGVVVTFIGGGIGVIAGSAAALALSGPVAGLESPPLFDWPVAGVALGLAITMGALPAAYAARKACQLDPTIALRSL